MAMAEKEIEKLLDWMEATEAPDLGVIEKQVLELRKRIGEEMTAEVIGGQGTVKPVPSPECPQCKQEMHDKGLKEKEISSLIGEVNLERGYYYCDHCRNGLFPPRQATRRGRPQLVREHHSGDELAERGGG